MKNCILPFVLLLVVYNSAAAQEVKAEKLTDHGETQQYEYATFYFVESSRWNVMFITHPDGRTENESHRFTMKESPRFGNYSWMMPRLNKLLSEGYRIISHSVSVEDGDGVVRHLHIYLLERAIGETDTRSFPKTK